MSEHPNAPPEAKPSIVTTSTAVVVATNNDFLRAISTHDFKQAFAAMTTGANHRVIRRVVVRMTLPASQHHEVIPAFQRVVVLSWIGCIIFVLDT